MKSSIFIMVCIGLVAFNCQNQQNVAVDIDENMTIHLNELSEDHPNKKQMELLLNTYEDELIMEKEINEDLNLIHLVLNRFEFHTKSKDINLTLMFFNNQQDALKLAEANFVNTGTEKFGINGATLFVVKGQNEYKLNNAIAWFSGEE